MVKSGLRKYVFYKGESYYLISARHHIWDDKKEIHSNLWGFHEYIYKFEYLYNVNVD